MIISSEILEPVVALLALNCIMLLWMFAVRLPTLVKMGYVPDPEAPRGKQMSELPARVRWKADNYDHLLEQPTIFYAVALVLALIGEGDGMNATLAWGYVGLRYVHSLVQATWNKVEVRFAVFAISSLFLITLVARAVMSFWS